MNIEKISGLVKKMKINEKTINYLLIFILGFLVGVAVKTEAKKRITIGYDDYLASQMKQDFDLMKPQISQGSSDKSSANNEESSKGQDESPTAGEEKAESQ
jgi:hypothetical protein